MHAFEHIDYLSLHEYDAPAVDSKIIVDADGYADGWKVLRYRRLLDWAAGGGMTGRPIKVPPIILSEFGVDGGGAGRGYRKDGAGIGDYLRGLRRVGVWLNEDIAEGILSALRSSALVQNDRLGRRSI